MKWPYQKEKGENECEESSNNDNALHTQSGLRDVPIATMVQPQLHFAGEEMGVYPQAASNRPMFQFQASSSSSPRYELADMGGFNEQIIPPNLVDPVPQNHVQLPFNDVVGPFPAPMMCMPGSHQHVQQVQPFYETMQGMYAYL
ncbi:hypothetical protein GUITHDRAFT_115421 [Guillardia theta CCMP2712]|uniref:Uncharacterized protein n=1 Tax=Guillardia theta (strain CCMP2712) TaxID=905079 RepID=L1IRK2_GUITC|nr:hypothetical protein GUITHDRAFT_115421 [Guillardia theta CCMP2712]EKX38455.1 hypothetical protein GUITHDRAFT_115421 [Guillardia theta CCMP2712]|eukprot:XP_005825435.1 hypothetical protein GUITHDRAFT_115421 [Guillardia theta CCMP2712]